MVVSIFLTIVPPLVRQARDLATALPGMIDRAQEFLMQHGIIDHRMTLREAVTKGPLPDAGGYVDTVFSAVGSILGGLFGFFTILILTFYLLVDADNLLGGFLQLFPRDRRTRVAAACREVTVKVSAWLMGQIILASVIGVTAAIGLWLLGIPYFYVLALIAGIGEMIPMVGPLLAALPSIAVAFTVSPTAALLGGALLHRAAAAREPRARAENHGAAGGRERRDGDRRADDRRLAPRHHGRHPRRPDRRHPPGRHPAGAPAGGAAGHDAGLSRRRPLGSLPAARLKVAQASCDTAWLAASSTRIRRQR